MVVSGKQRLSQPVLGSWIIHSWFRPPIQSTVPVVLWIKRCQQPSRFGPMISFVAAGQVEIYARSNMHTYTYTYIYIYTIQNYICEYTHTCRVCVYRYIYIYVYVLIYQRTFRNFQATDDCHGRFPTSWQPHHHDVKLTFFQLTKDFYIQIDSYGSVLFSKLAPRRMPGTTW